MTEDIVGEQAVAFIPCGLLASVSAARKVLVGDEHELRILKPRVIFGRKAGSLLISATANIIAWVHRKARRSNLKCVITKNHNYRIAAEQLYVT